MTKPLTKPQSPTHRVIIDTDPGIDDAMAIAFAFNCPEIEVLGLTSVFGNHDVEISTRNALCLLEHLGRSDVPVSRGAGRPLSRAYRGPVPFVHGADGLGDAGLTREPCIAAGPQNAVEFIINTVMSKPGEVTLVPIGPLTNIALALALEPKLAQATKAVVLMGGALHVAGNVTALAEANFYNDPEAAAQVLAADWPVTVVGLDATHAIRMRRTHLDELALHQSPTTNVIARAAPKYFEFHRTYFGMEDEMYIHDILAVAYLVAPQLFALEPCSATVNLHGENVGAVVPLGAGPRVPTFCVGVDSAAMLRVLFSRLRGRPS